MAKGYFTPHLASIDEDGALQMAHLINPMSMGTLTNKKEQLPNYNFLMSLILKHRRNTLALMGALIISMCICNTASARSGSDQRLLSDFSGSIVMCERPIPVYNFIDDPYFSSQRHAKNQKLLLLKDEATPLGQSGIGSQMNSLLHAFDYARYNDMELGFTMDSWAMKVIHTIFIPDYSSSVVNGKTATFAELMEKELGVKIITDERQLQTYSTVESGTSQDLLKYQPPSLHKDWKMIKQHHVFILQRLFRLYNNGKGFGNDGNESEKTNSQMCSTFHSLLGDDMTSTSYAVIHSKDFDSGASDATPTGSVITSEYMSSVLKEMGMSEYPIILLSDESTASQIVEEELKMNPTIAKNLKIVYSHTDLTGPEAMVAILSNVFIGSPGSATSGFIARSRYALGYTSNTLMFNKDTLAKWETECQDDCVFNPWIMQKLI